VGVNRDEARAALLQSKRKKRGWLVFHVWRRRKKNPMNLKKMTPKTERTLLD